MIALCRLASILDRLQEGLVPRLSGLSDAARSSLAEIDPGATAGKAAMERSEVEPGEIQHVIFGNALQTGRLAIYGARHVALKVIPQASLLRSNQLERFRGDAALALAAYHSGPGTPWRWRQEAPGAPGLAVVRQRATPRTRAYVERVLRRRAWFEGKPGGEGER